MTYSPRITVATVVEDNGKFLMVREMIQGELRYNQPTGHVEAGEHLMQAARREALEETAWEVELNAFVGVFVFQVAPGGPVYHRYCFAGDAKHFHAKPESGRASWREGGKGSGRQLDELQ